MIALKRRLVDRRNEEEQYLFQKHQKEVVPTVAIRRRSFFFAFLVVVCQYATVDSANMLPAIIIFYSMGVALSLELLSGESDVFGLEVVEPPLPNDVGTWMYPEEEFRQLLGLAQFEYFVLKNRPQTRFARVQERSGRYKLFAI